MPDKRNGFQPHVIRWVRQKRKEEQEYMKTTIACGKQLAHRADISESKFDDVNLSRSEFRNVNMKNVRFEDINLSDAILEKINFNNVQISNANYSGMKIEGILVEDLLSTYKKVNS